MKTVSALAGILLLLGIFFGVYKYIDTRYALAEELKLVSQRLEYKIKDDQRFSIQQEMRQIEERNLGKPIEKWDQRDRLRYKDLQNQLDKVQEKLKGLQ
jgi:hypothetical protein